MILFRDQRSSAISRAVGLQRQLEEKSRELQQAANVERAEAMQRLAALSEGTTQAKARSRDLQLTLQQARREVAQLRQRQHELRELVAALDVPGGDQVTDSSKLAGHQQLLGVGSCDTQPAPCHKLEAVEAECQRLQAELTCWRGRQQQRGSAEEVLNIADAENQAMVQDVIMAFTEGAAALFHSCFEQPIQRRGQQFERRVLTSNRFAGFQPHWPSSTALQKACDLVETLAVVIDAASAR